MSRDRWSDLQEQARERAGRDRPDRQERGRGAPEPGDLFVLPETADVPVEWAILERDPQQPQRLLAVPADANPLAGSADVEVSEDEPGGPLSLRCGFGLWIDAAAFAPGRRTGVLGPAVVAEALRKWRELQQGEPSASPLAWEVDADPEYRDWLADTAARAREAMATRRPGAGGPERAPRVIPFPDRWLRLAAAALLAVSAGLSGWVAVLLRELSESVFDPPAREVTLGSDPRSGTGEIVVQVPPEASRFEVRFLVGRRVEGKVGLIEIVAPNGEVVFRSPPRPVERLEVPLSLARRKFQDGQYLVRLLEGPGPGGDLLDEVVLTVKTAE